MINSTYGIAFDLKGYTHEEVKRGLHAILKKLFDNYYDKDWDHNRISVELTTHNVFLENEDLAKMLFCPEITALESALRDEFAPSVILAFCIDDSGGGRGFALYETDKNRKRHWIDSEIDPPGNAGAEIAEEGFVRELTETVEGEGVWQSTYYSHPEFKDPLPGQRGIIEAVLKKILLGRFMFDYAWQEFRGEAKTVERDDFPIQDLQLLFGES